MGRYLVEFQEENKKSTLRWWIAAVIDGSPKEVQGVIDWLVGRMSSEREKREKPEKGRFNGGRK